MIKETEEPKIPELPANWDRCHAYMEKKRRYCRQQRRGKSLYCGNHSHLDISNKNDADASTDGAGYSSQTGERKRIPCPADPSHMIWEDQVAKHVPICPKTKKRKLEQAEQYFQKNINGGGFGDMCTFIKKDHKSPKDEMEWAKQLALRILEVHHRLFSAENATTSTSCRLEELTFEDLHNSIEMRDYSAPELSAGITDGFQAHRIRSGGARHIPQLASLIGHLRAIGVLPSVGKTQESTKEITDKPLLLIDMGAGRGMLGLTAAGVSRSYGLETHLMMVERAGTRSKAEKILRNLGKGKDESVAAQTYLSFEDVQWTRVKCDLLHVNLKVLLEKPELKNSKVIIVAKHLCGVGSDLALKAVEPVKDRVDACIFATCCHGVCNWNGYVGRDYLRRHMETGDNGIRFGSKEFDLLRQWCAGSVASQPQNQGDKEKAQQKANWQEMNGSQKTEADDDGEAEHSVPAELFKPSRTNISAIVESLNLKCGIAGLGRACQRLIDHGRLLYLRNNLFEGVDSANVGMFHYVPPQTTPQNALLVASRIKTVS